MRNHYKVIAAAVLLGTATSAMAKWSCTSVDRGGRHYSVVGGDMQWAMKKSFKTCVRNSPYPRSCTISASSCVRVGGGGGYYPKPYPVKRCVVVDARGRTWVANGWHACAKAVNQCRTWHYRHGIPNGGICQVR